MTPLFLGYFSAKGAVFLNNNKLRRSPEVNV